MVRDPRSAVWVVLLWTGCVTKPNPYWQQDVATGGAAATGATAAASASSTSAVGSSGTTTADTTASTTSAGTSSSTAATSTSSDATDASTGSTDGLLECSNGDEVGHDEASARFDQGGCPGPFAGSSTGTLHGQNDEDWFYVEVCPPAGPMTATVDLDVSATVCAYLACLDPDTDVPVFCTPTGGQAQSPQGDHPGCCGVQSVTLGATCLGADSRVYVVVGPPAEHMCVDYAYSYEIG